jgi:hypothetical protein
MRKLIFKYSEETVIRNNLEMQTIQRSLKEYGVLKPTFEVVTNPNFLSRNYDRWDKEKQNKFISLLGGRVQFKKIKQYIESIERNKEYEKVI